MRARERLVFGLVVTVVLTGFVALSIGYLPQARLAPLVIGLPSLALMLGQLWQLLSPRRTAQTGRRQTLTDVRGTTGGTETGKDSSVRSNDATAASILPLATEVSIIGWIAGFIALIWLVGFTAAIPAFLFLMARVRFRESVTVAAGLSVAVGVGLYLAFGVLLKVQMNCGILFKM